MKNVTITLDENLAAWAKVEAAKQGKSLSRYIADLLKDRKPSKLTQSEALERFLKTKWPIVVEDGWKREDLYDERDEQLFHRHQPAALPEGSK